MATKSQFQRLNFDLLQQYRATSSTTCAHLSTNSHALSLSLFLSLSLPPSLSLYLSLSLCVCHTHKRTRTHTVDTHLRRESMLLLRLPTFWPISLLSSPLLPPTPPKAPAKPWRPPAALPGALLPDAWLPSLACTNYRGGQWV